MFKHEPVDLGYTDLATISKGGRQYVIEKTDVKTVYYPSITTLLSNLSKEAIKAWRERVGHEEANKISRQAAGRGTAVHAMCELYVNNNPDYARDVMPNILNDFNRIKNILDTRIGIVYGQELPLYSDHLGVAGRVDCVAEFDGKLSIIDYKTSKKTKKYEWCHSYFMQECFYAIAWEERTGIPITQLVTIISVDDAEPQVFIEHRDDWSKELVKVIEKYST
jgi:genome maintenance exonuclease 1